MTAIMAAAAILLVVAGSQKLVDPYPTATAVRQARLPAAAALIRAGGLSEVALGAWFIVAGNAAASGAIAAAYLAFAGFVAVAMAKGIDGSCGCFGRSDTPPTWLHVVINVALAIVAVSYATGAATSPLDALTESSGGSLALAAGIAVLVPILISAYSFAPYIAGKYQRSN